MHNYEEIGDGPFVLPAINPSWGLFPYCLVWTPVPIVSWVFPFIGHMGICLSYGVIHDYCAHFCVSENEMCYGRPARYLRLTPENVPGGRVTWDSSIITASSIYGGQMYNFFWNNCYSHVAEALSDMQYGGIDNWNMFILAGWMFFCGKYVGVFGLIRTWLPFIAIIIFYMII